MELFFSLRSVHERIFLCDGGVEMVVVVERLMFGCGKRGRLHPTQPLQTRNMHTSAPAGSLSWTTLSVWHLARAPRQTSTTSETAVVCMSCHPRIENLATMVVLDRATIVNIRVEKLVVAEAREREHPYWEAR